MSAGRVAIRYARAFLDALEEKKASDQVESFYAFCDLVAQNAELNALFANVTVSGQAKAAVAESIGAKMNLGETVRRFHSVLALNGRLGILSHVRDAVTRSLDERTRTRSVRLTTAAPLSEDEMAAFQNNMEQALDARVRVSAEVDASILGGAIAHVGSFIYDGSVSGRLSRLRKELVKEN